MLACFILLSIRQPPGATLFPYTTLFRSCDEQSLGNVSMRDERPLGMDQLRSRPARTGEEFTVEWSVFPPPCQMVKDRKSTRLNSSHVRISYAVFCSKKKTNIIAHGTHWA